MYQLVIIGRFIRKFGCFNVIFIYIIASISFFFYKTINYFDFCKKGVFIADHFGLFLITINMYMFIVICAIKHTIRLKIKHIKILWVLNFLVNLLFLSSNILIFFASFEIAILPMLILVIGWGRQPERLIARRYLILYRLVGGLPFLLFIYYSYITIGRISFVILIKCHKFCFYTEHLIIISLFGFLIKLPIYGLHFWLPKVHVESPTNGRMLLAGVFLKMGVLGIIRVLNYFTQNKIYLILPWALISMVLLSVMCVYIRDSKIIIAHSSIIHIAPTLYLLFSSRMSGYVVSLILCLSHGLTSFGLFYLCGSKSSIENNRNLFLSKGESFTDSLIMITFFMFILINSSIPPFLRFVTELTRIWLLFKITYNMVVFSGTFICFFIFLYSVFIFYKLYQNFKFKCIFLFWIKGNNILIITYMIYPMVFYFYLNTVLL